MGIKWTGYKDSHSYTLTRFSRREKVFAILIYRITPFLEAPPWLIAGGDLRLEPGHPLIFRSTYGGQCFWLGSPVILNQLKFRGSERVQTG